MRFVSLLTIAGVLMQGAAADDRLGVATHFEQSWSASSVIPAIPASGASYVRDDLYAGGQNTGGRAGDSGWEYPAGSYHVPGYDAAWMTLAHQNGLRVVGVLGPNGNYTNPYDPVAMANLAAFIAGSGLVDVLEVLNEPNNTPPFNSGASGQAAYVQLLSGVYKAVHEATGAAVQVIGTDFQGSYELQVLALKPQCDGIVYHPYPPQLIVPEQVYEPPYGDYQTWVAMVKAATNLPIWETEWGVGTAQSISEYSQAVFHSRRLLMALGAGVQHTFVYDFKDENDDLNSYYYMSGIVRASLAPKQSFWAIQRVVSTLYQCVPQSTNVQLLASSGFNAGDFKSVLFQGPNGKTVAAVWVGNQYPNPGPSGMATISFHVVGPGASVLAINAINGGQYIPVSHSDSNWNYTVNNMSINGEPQLIIVH